jgi:acyl-[acyl-carrier-protein] desaturase
LRDKAVVEETRQVLADFFLNSVPRRIWEPLRDLPFDEMAERASQLSSDTIHLLEGFMGVEEYVGDYVQNGLEALRGASERRRLFLQWGAEEGRHGSALQQVLLHTGARTQQQLDDYGTQLAERRWTPEQHHGMDSAFGALVYATFQERATYTNYVELRLRVRAEYELPASTTPAESERGQEYGVSEALRRIALDEVAHHAVFLKLLRIHLSHFPELTMAKISEVVEGFAMPALKLIPSRRQFVASVLRTQLYGEAKHEARVVQPTMKQLGIGPGLPQA